MHVRADKCWYIRLIVDSENYITYGTQIQVFDKIIIDHSRTCRYFDYLIFVAVILYFVS